MHDESTEKGKYVTAELAAESILFVSLKTERKQNPLGHVMLLGKQRRDLELRNNVNSSGEGGGSSMQLVKLMYGCV